MRSAFESTAVACCFSLAAMGASLALEPSDMPPTAPVQCQDKPNLTNIIATMGDPYLLEGGEPEAVTDDVMMIDFNVAVENAGGADAAASRVGYTAKVSSVDGQLVETISGVAGLDWTPAGETEQAFITVMATRLADLLQPSGAIAASVAFRAVIDVDNEVDECDETDNTVEMTADLKISDGGEQNETPAKS